MLMRLNRLWSRLEMTIRPPPGGPIPANRNMSYKAHNQPIRTPDLSVWNDHLTGENFNRVCLLLSPFHSLLNHSEILIPNNQVQVQ